MKKFILLASVAILALGNTSEAGAKIRCVFSNNNAKVTISGEGNDIAFAMACNNTNSSSTDDGWTYNSDWRKSVKDINIGNGVTSIARRAFILMNGVTSLTISDSVTSIGQEAFEGMSSVTSLVIPEGVTSIGAYSLKSMSGITGELVIPDSVTSIGDQAFYGMKNVTSITIPDSVTSVGAEAFYGVKEILIPDNLMVTDNWNYMAFNNSPNIRCLGDLDKCINALKKYLPKSQGGSCTITYYCLNINKIVPATKEQCGVGMYTWNEATEKCNRMTEWQCNDYRDKNNKRKYYYNGNTCTKLPKDGKIACANACYKINDGYCDRVCYTPAEAAEIAKDSGNVVTLTFKKQ